MTHDELVAQAGRWLKNTRKCKVVFVEHVCQSVDEFPDAIGWRPGGWSISVECKVSKGDFYKDKSKPFHQDDRAMGCERYYMAPVGLLTVDDVRKRGAGLLGMKGKKRLIVSEYHPAPKREPHCWLRSAKSRELSEIAHLVVEVARRADVPKDVQQCIDDYRRVRILLGDDAPPNTYSAYLIVQRLVRDHDRS